MTALNEPLQYQARPSSLPGGCVRELAAGIELLRGPGAHDGPPFVLLHGIGSNAGSWGGVIDALPPAPGFIAWNAPGYGVSRPLSIAEPSPDDYAQRLEEVLTKLGLARVVLVGHSLGCLIAGRFAATRPEKVAALLLLSPALGYRTPAGMPLPPSVQARTDELRAMGPEAFAAKRAPRLVSDPATKPAVANAVRRAMASVDPASYAQAVRALGAGDLLADAARLRVPTLVGVGLQDLVTPPSNAEALAAVLSVKARAGAAGEPVAVATAVIVPEAGHALPQEQPERVARLMLTFAGSLR